VPVIGFVIRIYHDARSPERQTQNAQSNIHNHLNKTPQEILRYDVTADWTAYYKFFQKNPTQRF